MDHRIKTLWHRILALAGARRPASTDLQNMVFMLETEGEQAVGAALALGAARYPPGVIPLVRLLENPRRFWVDRGAAAVALGEYGEAAFAALPALARAARYEWREGDETWDERAHIAVLDAIDRIREPGKPSRLSGHGARFEMWGRY